jgi:hypothetical protein
VSPATQLVIRIDPETVTAFTVNQGVPDIAVTQVIAMSARRFHDPLLPQNH